MCGRDPFGSGTDPKGELTFAAGLRKWVSTATWRCVASFLGGQPPPKKEVTRVLYSVPQEGTEYRAACRATRSPVGLRNQGGIPLIGQLAN